MKDFLALFRAELGLHLRQRREWAPFMLFFVIVIVLLPFALGPEPELLRRLAPGLIWLAAVLMSLLVFERLFVADARDGIMDVMLLSPLPLPLIVMARMLAEIAALLCALLLMLIPGALLLGLTSATIPMLAVTLLLGVPSLVLLGGIMAAITVALQRNPALLTLLLVPFYIPVVIFATSACDAATLNTNTAPDLLFLVAILVLLLPIAPFIIAAALRQGEI